MIAVVCPGQGSQTPGFLRPWLETGVYRDQLRGMSEAIGLDLEAHGTTSDADTIRDTAIAQPLIVASGLLTLSTLLADGRRERIAGIAGHSVGEFTAAAGAGILSPVDALRLVRERGLAMADAAAEGATGMSAVVGGSEADVLERIDTLGLDPANYNGGGQIVVAGDLAALDVLRSDPPRGARVIPLQVAGAFHTAVMSPAVERLRAAAADVVVSDPITTVWTNRDGSTVDTGAAFLDLLIGQVSSPVRWDLTMDAFAHSGITGIVEVAPAGALIGLAKRGLKGLPSVAIKTPDDLAAAFDLIDGTP